MRTKCRHDRSSWHYLGVPFIIQGWIWTNIGTNVGTIAQVGTISAYLSLYKKGVGKKCKVDVLQSGIGPILAKVCLIESGFGPKLSKVGIIGGGFGPKFGKVDTIGSRK